MGHIPKSSSALCQGVPCSRSVSDGDPRKGVIRVGRDNRQDKKCRQSRFVSTSWDVLNSKAYKDLPPTAAKALPYFLGRPKMSFNDLNYLKTVFPFTYPEARRLGFASATWAKVLRDLVAYGFIDPKSKGGLRGAGKTSAQFQLSNRWKKYGQAEFENVDLRTWGT